MDKAANSKLVFGMSADKLEALCRSDRVLNELVADYQTLTRELRTSQGGCNETDAQFWSDYLETLHALDGEIRSCLSRIDQNVKTKGT